MSVDFPYAVDGRGRTASTDADGHLRDLVAQVLFTAPGERVMRPDFGAGLLGLVFEPNGSALAAATQASVDGALQLWLADVIQVESVQVRAEESTLAVTVAYVVRATQERRVERVRSAGAS